MGLGSMGLGFQGVKLKMFRSGLRTWGSGFKGLALFPRNNGESNGHQM